MKRIFGTLKKRTESDDRSAAQTSYQPAPTGDGPEALVVREVTAFCESGAPGSQTAGDEYLHLPAIVENAESSPAAAKYAADTLKRYLSKDHYQRGFAQYNAIMLLRILCDNPGRGFTQNFDKDFIATVKRCLRETKDSSVQQILRETLDYLEAEKVRDNDTLIPLVQMWSKEKGQAARIVYPRSGVMAGYPQPPTANRPKTLPAPDELAARIEEAKTTARLLLQTIQSTPSSELLSNDLVKEFADRARAAQKSIQGYMNCENPHPDDDTMLTLIETNEQLNIAISKHHRSILQARKATSPSPNPSTQNVPQIASQDYAQNPSAQNGSYLVPNGYENTSQQPPQRTTFGQNRANAQDFERANQGQQFAPPPGPPPGARGAVRRVDETESQVSPVQPQSASSREQPRYELTDPFADEASYEQPPQQNSYSLFGRGANTTEQPERNSYGQPVSENPYSTSRPGYGGLDYQPTASYIHRQESASNHITMHGASPPPGQTSR